MELDSLDVAVRVENLGKRYWIGSKTERPTLLQTARRWMSGASAQRALWALRGIDFELRKGEILGVIGPNGSGKSTILLLIAQIIAPTEGGVRVYGKTNPFFQLSAGLQPELTVLENFSLCAALLGMPRAEFKRRLPEIVAFSGLEPYLYAKFMELSSGLAARLPFSAAVHADLDILLVDEMLAVGDVAFQKKCKETFQEFQRQGKTLLIVSHNMDMIRSLCPRVLYLREGSPAVLGDAEEAISRFLRDMGLPEAGRRLPASTPAAPASDENDGAAAAELKSLAESVRVGNERLLKQEEALRAISEDVKDLKAAPAPFSARQADLAAAELKGLAETTRDGGERLLKQEEFLRAISDDVRRLRAAPAPSEAQRRQAEFAAAELKSLAESVRLGNERLLTVEQSLLAISRAVDGLKMEPAPPATDYRVVLETAVHDWRGLLGHKGPLMLCDSPVSTLWTAAASLMAPGLEGGLRAGDEVLVPSLAYPGLVGALRAFGLVPVFVGADRETFNVDVERLQGACGRKTRAAIVVHSYGSCAPMDRVAAWCREKGLWLLELNRYAGAQFDRKPLGAFGDVGAYANWDYRSVSDGFGLVFAQSAGFDAVFRRIMFGPTGDSVVMPDGEDFDFPLVQALGGRPRPSSLLVDRSRALHRKWTDAVELRGSTREIRTAYAHFFSSFPDLFAVPAPPASADIPHLWFSVMLKAEAAVSMEELIRRASAKKIELARSSRIFEHHAEEGSGPASFSRVLWERSLGILMRRDEEGRRRDFDELEKLLPRSGPVSSPGRSRSPA